MAERNTPRLFSSSLLLLFAFDTNHKVQKQSCENPAGSPTTCSQYSEAVNGHIMVHNRVTTYEGHLFHWRHFYTSQEEKHRCKPSCCSCCRGLLTHLNRTEPLLVLLATCVSPTMTRQNVCCERRLLGLTVC